MERTLSYFIEYVYEPDQKYPSIIEIKSDNHILLKRNCVLQHYDIVNILKKDNAWFFFNNIKIFNHEAKYYTLFDEDSKINLKDF